MKVNVKLNGLDKLLKKMKKVTNGNLHRQFSLWLEAQGFELVDELQEQIRRLDTVDTRRLLNSFDKGSEGNVWKIKNGGLTLMIGTNIKYAKAVNDGHWTNPPGVKTRWVPGRWQGERFIYEPGSDTGMLLKQQWIDGQPYWDSAIVIYKKIFAKSFERKFKQWLKNELGGG
jgi:hypothetical protein